SMATPALLSLEGKHQQRNLYFVLMDKIKKLSKHLASFCKSCLKGWKFVGSSCYFFSVIEKKWEEARDDCPHYKKFKNWIGLRRDDKIPDVWKWLDGTEPGFKKWNLGKPNNYGDRENCGEIKSGAWNDAYCDSTSDVLSSC
uniref:C-type lectin domain-containing protein n=1 Tax=Leptobrachium leishanense TaxID=445787 RepID=A0A8C5QRR2_9ANUR